MRKHFWIGIILAIFISTAFVFSVSSNNDRAVGITLLSPSICPSGGCAAGQRLNFSLNFSVSPLYAGTNTQVCVYAPVGGWADYSTGWISDEGLVSASAYSSGETNSLCSNNIPAGYQWLTGAYSTLAGTETNDGLELALTINPLALTSGSIRVLIFEADAGGNWAQTDNLLSSTISVAPLSTSVFIANTAADCSANSPCFVNSGDDLANGLGTGLRDAVTAITPGSTLQILSDYVIKSKAVLINKAVTIKGVQDASLAYSGAVCTAEMLSISSGVTIQNLTVDGTCGSSSRNLIDIDSAEDVTIENNTLTDGSYGVLVRNNTGNVKITFNAIENNANYAVFQENSGSNVEIYANNFIDNASSIQVICNSTGDANHNFWGDGVSATSSVYGCSVSNGKSLGAAILTSAGTPGVSAEQVTVTATKQYAFSSKIAYSHSGGTNYDLVIVNHGQGSGENVPFYTAVGDSITPCSNYYDVFLADGESPSSLTLSLKYDLDANCTSKIESTAYCGSGSMANYPLWWYDPANNVTDYWDKTGQTPEGSGAGSSTGQTTTCDMAANELRVTLTNDSGKRPNLTSDLNFTPLVAGLPNDGGINLSQFTVTFDMTENKVRWSTTSESNISGFHVLRSDSENGTYARISSLIASIGDTNIGGIYYFVDETIQFTHTYYYKLEVVNKQGDTVEFYGPVSVITSTATPTSTLTRTPTQTRTLYPTRTATPYYYRSPTSYYLRATATSIGGPTQVRTYGPTPTPSRTSATKPTYNPSSESESDGYPAENYPVDTQIAPGQEGYPSGGDSGYAVSTPTPSPDEQPGSNPSNGTPGVDDNSSGENPSQDGQSQTGGNEIQWPFLILGVTAGILALAGLGFILIKTRIN